MMLSETFPCLQFQQADNIYVGESPVYIYFILTCNTIVWREPEKEAEQKSEERKAGGLRFRF